MKTEIKIIGISIILGFLIGLTDTIVDYFMFYEKPFLDLLIFDVSRFEIYIRSIIMAVFIISGLIISKIFVKQKHAEQELKERNNFLDLILNSLNPQLHLVEGDPEQVIQSMITDNKVELVVMGTVARSNLAG